MKRVYLILSVCLLFFSGCATFKWTADPTTVPDVAAKEEPHYIQETLLKPERLENYPSDQTCISIVTQTPGAEIYINTNFQGQTPIQIKNLMPGIYTLQVKSYDENDKILIRQYLLEIEKEQKQFYYIQDLK